jgi:hypothetical protein
MTSAYLDRTVTETLARFNVRQATLAQKQTLAAVIHLCGAGGGAAYVRRGLHLVPGQHCGDHDVASYVVKVKAMQRVFTKLAVGP